MKRFIFLVICAVALLASCTHKELCYNHRDHAHKYHVNVIADYRYDWEEYYGHINWIENWPENYIPYDDLRPLKPGGLRVVNYNLADGYNLHNISADGGVVNLYEGANNILFYNNDTEYIIFSRQQTGSFATTRATTRTKTRATFVRSKYSNEGEETMTPPDMLYANFIENHIPEKVADPAPLEITLQPLVYTYKVRYEFEKGLEYAVISRGALSGMARSVTMDTGDTSKEPATLIYDCEMTEYGARALVTTFGIPDFPNAKYPTRADGRKHALSLEVQMRNGKLINFDFDVTDQVLAQPHGGVIVVGGIVIEESVGTSGSGAFDVEVNDWGEYEDIYLPL